MANKTETLTKGNVIVENIKVGDILYEYSGPFGIEAEVITKPKKDKDGNWSWTSKNTLNGKEIKYFVHRKYPHYAPNLYDYKAYKVSSYI